MLLSYVAYVNLEGLSVGAGEEQGHLRSFQDGFFVLHSEEELAADKSFTRLAPYIVKMMAQSNRYRTSIISNYVNMVNPQLELQFSAVQLDLSDGSKKFLLQGNG